MTPHARFDDLTAGTAVEMTGYQDAVVARSPEDVIPALRSVEKSVASGLWAAGFVSYEAAPGLDGALEVRSRLADEPFGTLPLVWFGLFQACEEAKPLVPRIARPAPYSVSTWTPSIRRQEYEFALDDIKAHIGAGDTYQVNHTFRLRASFAGSSCELYRDMALAQGGAYGAHLCGGRYEIASASPELFFERVGDRVTVKPMKGTARRGRYPDEDARRARELQTSKKERAENLIIVDLIRNDLGRIARFGTVDVERMYELERYETVWQLTSTIAATARQDAGLAETFAALFPCGSVTGAPKPKTMEIIAEIEDSPRGVYCGAIGRLAPPDAAGPSARFSVAIRTVAIDTEEGVAEYGVGGGITWDSETAGEYEEARSKAQVLVVRRPDFELLETMRVDAEGIWWLDRHLARMEQSADYFGFAWDRSAAAAAAAAAAERLGPGAFRLRLTVDRAGAPSVDVAPLASANSGPEDVVLDTDPVNSQNPFLFHKTTHRREYDRRAERHPGAGDVLLVNERGEVTESTTANVLVKLGSSWFTPPLDSGCLAGIYREVLLEEGAVSERLISVGDVRRAAELALVNSVRLRRTAVLKAESALGTVMELRRAR